jgi:phosphate transport system protein
VSQEAHDLQRRYHDVHERLVALIARQAPFAGDLRLAAALLHVSDRLERMSAQCMNIVTLCDAFPANERPSTGQRECLSGMATLAVEQMAEAARVFAERDVDGARRLSEHDLGINERNRHCFALAVREGHDEARREVAFLVALMARAIERIGDNAVDIGRQAAFVASGRLEREPADRCFSGSAPVERRSPAGRLSRIGRANTLASSPRAGASSAPARTTACRPERA